MTKQLLLHPQTRQDIERFILAPKHALLITGADGSGKTTLAEETATQILALESRNLQDHPYFMAVNQTPVGIDQIRAVTTFLRLRTTGKQNIRRVVIIKRADTMTVEAQNALLKSLEEPPEDTLIILLAERAQSLLPTITSRTATVSIRTPSYDAIKEYFSTSEDLLAHAYALSNGKVGLLQALLSDDTSHPLTIKIAEAKQLLQMTTYAKLTQVNALAADKENTRLLLAALKQIAIASIKRAQDPRNSQRWYKVFDQSHRAEKLLNESVNTKLVLTDLLLNL